MAKMKQRDLVRGFSFPYLKCVGENTEKSTIHGGYWQIILICTGSINPILFFIELNLG